MQRAAVIVNPRSGRNRGRAVAEAARAALVAAGLEAAIFETRGPGDATRLAHESAPEHDLLVPVGGDGTVREVLEGLTPDTERPLLIVPCGTANVLAREFGLPLKDPGAAVAAALAGCRRAIDVGLVNGVPFLANVGVGFDADVVHELDRRRRALPAGRSISMASYLPIGLGLLARHRPPPLRVWIDGVELDESFAEIIVCNTANYGGVMSLTPDADCGDGLLDLCLRRRRGRLAVLPHLVSALTRWKDSRGVLRRRARRIEIRAEAAAAVQADGDPRGWTPITIELRERRATFLVPEGAKR